ncbi:PREDICTED: uncharacterized protein LOC104806849 [Tarenaya hassleriana]|uniref:uncharacterized protein LOC104806849 n=1 Tax=Tarenaya hassleriana TaxID=28532 RepID=UPI0008FD5088|nr:PREDICTED: uncharacterized protein LOC104806849 [Tarenaya hassleriana]
MASSNAVNSPHPTPGDDTTVIVVVFVSVGCVLFLAFFACVICFLFRMKCKKRVEKTETVQVDEHLKVREAIVDGPHGPHAVVISVEDDVRIQDEIKKDEKAHGNDSKARGMDEGSHGSVGPSCNSDVEQYYSPIRK